MTRSLLAGVAVCLLARAALGQQAYLIERDTIELAPDQGVAIEAVTIDNRFGDVTVVGRDEPTAAVSVIKRAPDGETLERLKVRLIPEASGAIQVTTSLMFGREAQRIPAGAVRIDVTVMLPREARVDVRAWNGRLTAAGLRRGARVAGHDADITVEDVEGPVTTTATHGTQRLKGVRGAVSADHLRGELSLDSISGDRLAARVHEGDVTATRIRSLSVEIRTTFGQISFQGELLAGGRVDLGTYKGDVRVRLARTPPFEVRAFTREGAVESQAALADAARADAHRLRGTYGALGATKPALLQLSSVHGDLTLSVGLINE